MTRLQSLRSCYEDHAVRPSPSTGAPSGEAPQGQGQKPHSSHQTCSRVQGGELIPPRVQAIHTLYRLCFAQWKLGTATEYPHEGAVRRPGLDGGASPGWGALWGQRGQGILAAPQFPPPPDPPQKPCCCRTRRFAPAEWPLTPRWAPPPSGHTPVEGTARGGSGSLFSNASVVPSENDP